MSDWKEAITALDGYTALATPQQRALAEIVGESLGRHVPAIDAAAVLRHVLRDQLMTDESTEIRPTTKAYLDDLIVRIGISVEPATQAEAEAWIAYCHLQIRRGALAALKLRAGDVVEVMAGPSAGRVAVVSSIGDSGVVYLKGRGQAWPDLLVVRARVDATHPEAAAFRRRAANDAAERRGTQVASASLAHLERFRTRETLSMADVAKLSDVIDAAADEKPIQGFLQERPYVLTSLMSRDPRYCIPQQTFEDYRADFLLADVDSLGIHWLFVELESPKGDLALSRSNQLSKQARKGLSQVEEWREWLQDNLARARASPREQGLGLTGVRPNSDGLVLVSRRSKSSLREQRLRNQAWERTRTKIHTYDWLLDALTSIASHTGPPLANRFVRELFGDSRDVDVELGLPF